MDLVDDAFSGNTAMMETELYERMKESDLEAQEQAAKGDFWGIQSQLEIVGQALLDTDTDEWIEDMDIVSIITDNEKKPPSISRKDRKVIRYSVA